MRFGQKPVFIGLHFAKTGGTSIRAHAANNLGKGAFLPYGIFASVNNFFNGRPMLAEMSPRQRAKFRFVYGHGVNGTMLHHFADRDVALFVVCRDPYKRFVSSLKHVVRNERQFGGTVNPREVFDSQPANPFSTNVLQMFSGLAPDDIKDPKERLIAILQTFRFVMSTDDLDEQTKPFFAALGLPPLTEAKRVYREDADLGDLSEDEIRGRDELDAFVNETVNAHFSALGSPEKAQDLNPFGFDRKILRTRLKALAEKAPPIETEIEKAYDTLFGFLDRHGRLEAAKALIDAGQQSSAVAATFEKYCEKNDRRFDDGDLPSRNLCYQAEVLLKLNRNDAAGEAARRAIAADPNNPMAFYLSGRAAIEERRYAEGAADLEKAVELNPTQATSFRYLSVAYRHLGRDHDADQAMARAESI